MSSASTVRTARAARMHAFSQEGRACAHDGASGSQLPASFPRTSVAPLLTRHGVRAAAPIRTCVGSRWRDLAPMARRGSSWRRCRRHRRLDRLGVLLGLRARA
eukprot:359930-Chlamydomonas_euryale.AAC.3